MTLPSIPKIGLVSILLFNDSRKVGFGLWLWVFASLCFYFGKFTAEQWQAMTLLASAMIGGGTIADAAHEREMAKINSDEPPAKQPA